MKVVAIKSAAKAVDGRQVQFDDGSRLADDVQKALVDPQRYCPIFSGPCAIREDSLTLRHVTGEIEIRAPQQLLEIAFELCDGRNTQLEVLERFEQQSASPTTAADFAEFLNFLASEGVLIDAALGCAHHNAYAFQRSSFGKGDHPSVTRKIAERFASSDESKKGAPQSRIMKVGDSPLDEFFNERQSCYTFDAVSPSQPDFLKFLWSLAGIVNNEHPRLSGRRIAHRTIASAGAMHLLEVYVVAQRSVGDIPPGVYRVEYPREKAVCLRLVNEKQWLLPRAFGKPWQLKYATGAVFLAARTEIGALRYRNRSLQYLFMEAGAALQNASLSASKLGLGFATIGSYYEDIATKICELDTQLIFGSAIFGSMPKTKQLDLEKSGNQFDLAWVQGYSDRYSLPFYMCRVELKSDRPDLSPTWGRGQDPWVAVLKAQAEAVERLGYHEPRNLVIGKLTCVPGALDPQQFIRYGRSQYKDPAFPYRPLDKHADYAWATGRDLLSGSVVRVMADLVFARDALCASYPQLPPPYAQMTSSGCAAGRNEEDAVYRGLLELIERDAFTRHWLSQSAGSFIRPDCFPKQILMRVRALEQAGCVVSIQKLDSEWANVAMISAQNKAQHFTTMSTAAHPIFTDAVFSALEECEGRVFSHFSEHRATLNSFDEVTSPDHHFEIYRFKKYFRKADHVLFEKNTSRSLLKWPSPEPVNNLKRLLQRFKSAGKRPIVIDITPSNPTIDQGRARLAVVKTFVPSLMPIYFGHKREPLGMCSRVHWNSKFPHPFP